LLQLRYEALSLDKPSPSTPISSRKRKATVSASPEVQITRMVSKEDKIQHVNLSSSSSDDDDEQNSNTGIVNDLEMAPTPGPSQPPRITSTRARPSPPHVTLSSDEEDDDDEMRSQFAPVIRLPHRHSNTIPNTSMLPQQPNLLQVSANSREQHGKEFFIVPEVSRS